MIDTIYIYIYKYVYIYVLTDICNTLAYIQYIYKYHEPYMVRDVSMYDDPSQGAVRLKGLQHLAFCTNVLLKDRSCLIQNSDI